MAEKKIWRVGDPGLDELLAQPDKWPEGAVVVEDDSEIKPIKPKE